MVVLFSVLFVSLSLVACFESEYEEKERMEESKRIAEEGYVTNKDTNETDVVKKTTEAKKEGKTVEEILGGETKRELTFELIDELLEASDLDDWGIKTTLKAHRKSKENHQKQGIDFVRSMEFDYKFKSGRIVE